MFNLDTTAAKTDDSQSNRINESGIYSGVITRAEWSKSQSSQAQFINLDFKTDDGKESNYMNLTIKGKDGQNVFGYNILNKIMACCGLRHLSGVQMGEKMACPELTNARIKLALQAEPDWFKDKNTGEYKPTINMIISTPFKHGSGQSAKEILEQLPATQITTLKVSDRKAKDKPVDAPVQSWGNAPASHAPQMSPAYNQPSNDFDDSQIPF
jgi:hypothetical protein